MTPPTAMVTVYGEELLLLLEVRQSTLSIGLLDTAGAGVLHISQCWDLSGL
jgi:hypothetical protein